MRIRRGLHTMKTSEGEGLPGTNMHDRQGDHARLPAPDPLQDLRLPAGNDPLSPLFIVARPPEGGVILPPGWIEESFDIETNQGTVNMLKILWHIKTVLKVNPDQNEKQARLVPRNRIITRPPGYAMIPASGRRFTPGEETRSTAVDALPAPWPAGIIIKTGYMKRPMPDFLLPAGRRWYP